MAGSTLLCQDFGTEEELDADAAGILNNDDDDDEDVDP